MGFNAEEYYRSLGGSGQMPDWLKQASKAHGQSRTGASPRLGARDVNYLAGHSVPMTDNEQIRYHQNAQIIADDSGNKAFVNPIKGALNQKDDKFTFGGKQYQWQLQNNAGSNDAIAQQAFKNNVYKPEGATLQQLADTVAYRNAVNGIPQGKQYVPVEIGSGINRSFGQDEVQKAAYTHPQISQPVKVRQPAYKGDMPTARYNPNKHPSNSGIVSNPLVDGLNAFLSNAKQAFTRQPTPLPWQ